MQSLALFGFLCVGVLLPSAICQDECAMNGKDGVNGPLGRNGLPGAKGDKGASALQAELNSVDLKELKGDSGSRGPPGDQGPKGYPGLMGPGGSSGPKGLRGSSSGIKGTNKSQKPSFSVLRNNTGNAPFDKPVLFDFHLSNVNSFFNLRTGYYTCKRTGVYYVVFHASSEGQLCVRLRSDVSPEINLSFCDFSQKSQSLVVSGGAVLKLSENNKVWIEPFRKNAAENSPKSIYAVFNGFLIY